MGYSIDSLTDNCYPNTAVLINKLDIHEQKLLDEAEQMITAINYAKAEKEIKFENVDFEFYKMIHQRLFIDLYEWAGSVRNVDIFKKGTAFCRHDEIEYLAKKMFDRLKSNNYLKNYKYAVFLDEFTDLYINLNFLHPFREGNGRTQRLFLTLLAQNVGYSINFKNIDADILMIATIKSAQGDITLLKTVLNEILE